MTPSPTATGSTVRLLVGCFPPLDDPASPERGVVPMDIDQDTGGTTVGSPIPGAGPSRFLALHPDGRTVYSAEQSRVTQLRIDNGRWSALGHHVLGTGAWCHLSVHPDGHHVLLVDYAAGTVTVMAPAGGPAAGGALEPTDVLHLTGDGPDPERQSAAHPHQVRPTPDGRHVVVTDLGSDRLLVYSLDSAGGRLVKRSVTSLPAGAGPRHLAFGADRDLYVVGELDNSLLALQAGPDTDTDTDTGVGDETAGGTGADTGNARLTLTSTLPSIGTPPDGIRNYPSEIAASPDGRFVYVANRGADTVAVVAVSEAGLTPVQELPIGGAWPLHLVLAGGLVVVAAQRSDRVLICRRDPVSGTLSPLSDAQVPGAACLLHY